MNTHYIYCHPAQIALQAIRNGRVTSPSVRKAALADHKSFVSWFVPAMRAQLLKRDDTNVPTMADYYYNCATDRNETALARIFAVQKQFCKLSRINPDEVPSFDTSVVPEGIDSTLWRQLYPDFGRSRAHLLKRIPSDLAAQAGTRR
jgi:hypothetical protein